MQHKKNPPKLAGSVRWDVAVLAVLDVLSVLAVCEWMDGLVWQ